MENFGYENRLQRIEKNVSFRWNFLWKEISLYQKLLLLFHAKRTFLVCLKLINARIYCTKKDSTFWIEIFHDRSLHFSPPLSSLLPPPRTLVKLPRLRFQEEIPSTFYKFENIRSAVFAFRFRSSVYFWPRVHLPTLSKLFSRGESMLNTHVEVLKTRRETSERKVTWTWFLSKYSFSASFWLSFDPWNAGQSDYTRSIIDNNNNNNNL